MSLMVRERATGVERQVYVGGAVGEYPRQGGLKPPGYGLLLRQAQLVVEHGTQVGVQPQRVRYGIVGATVRQVLVYARGQRQRGQRYRHAATHPRHVCFYLLLSHHRHTQRMVSLVSGDRANGSPPGLPASACRLRQGVKGNSPCSRKSLHPSFPQ